MSTQGNRRDSVLPPLVPNARPIASELTVHLALSVVTVNPDSTWSWIVMTAAFWCQVIFGGTIFAVGHYVEVVAKDMNTDKSIASLFVSIFGGASFFVGPLVSVLVDWYGFRAVTIIGGVAACCGIAVSYFATSVTFLCCTYGIIGGVGCGMVFVPATIVVSFYFVRWRSLAICFALCGTGVGGCIMPILVDKSIHKLGWEITMAIQGALLLTCSIAALFYRPIHHLHVSPSTLRVIRRDSEDKPHKSILAILDATLFRSPSYLMLVFSGMMYMFMLLGVYVYLPIYAREAHVDATVRQYLMTCINITNIIGRILSGIVSNYGNKYALLFSNVVTTLGGIGLLLTTVSSSAPLQVICCLLFGMTIACFFALRPVILIELMGIERLTSAFGILMFVQGIAVIVGPPLTGMLAKATGKTESAIWLAGSMTIISGVITYPLFTVNRWERKRREKSEQNNRN